MSKFILIGVGIVLFSALSTSTAQEKYVWQNNEVSQAWRSGYQGQGAVIHVHDNFVSQTLHVKLDSTSAWGRFLPWGYSDLTHGEVVSRVASSTAPLAQIERDQRNDGTIKLQANRFNVVNLSYKINSDLSQVALNNARSLQVVNIASTGSALVVKAAGNDSKSLSDSDGSDVLNMALKSSRAVIFAGALEDHGTDIKTNKILWWSYTTGGTNKASYSNNPGEDPEYQNKFLMVGVPDTLTATGTSFAAPQISGYAAIVSSKFRSANPTMIASQLLNTARTDRIRGYRPELHGRGEASLARALAPNAIR